MSSNKQFARYHSRIRRAMYSAKNAPRLLKLWEGHHPGNRSQFPYTVADTARRSMAIILATLNRDEEWSNKHRLVRYKQDKE